MKSHEFKSDIIYREIHDIVQKNRGVIDADIDADQIIYRIIANLSERDIYVTSSVIKSRIKYYLENAQMYSLNI